MYFTTLYFEEECYFTLCVYCFYRYFVFTSKHHDGFTNWPSTYTFGWNSEDIGPKRDVVGELKKAFERHPDVHFGLYYSLFEWFNPMFLQDQSNQFTTRCDFKTSNIFSRNNHTNKYNDISILIV